MKINFTNEEYHGFFKALSSISSYRSTHYIRFAGINIKLVFHTPEIEEYGMGQLKFLEETVNEEEYTLNIIEDDYPWAYSKSETPYESIRYVYDEKNVFYNYKNSPDMMIGKYNGEIFITYKKIEDKRRYASSLGHFLYRCFAGLVQSHNAFFVHGGCISYRGKGILLSGVGGSGKSTLAASALLGGWDYAAEDYLILKKRAGTLYASPTYSTLNLSDEMLEKLPEFKAHDMGYRGWKGKHFIDISSFKSQVKDEISISAIVLPRITGDEKPSIERIPEAKPLYQMITSTVHQTATDTSLQSLTVALASLLRGLPAYQLNLTENLHKNLTFLESVMDII